MTTALWQQVPPREVELKKVNFSQEHLCISGILGLLNGGRPYAGDPYPHLVWFGGKLWLVDGHHRVIISIIRGEQTIKARLLIKDANET